MEVQAVAKARTGVKGIARSRLQMHIGGANIKKNTKKNALSKPRFIHSFI